MFKDILGYPGYQVDETGVIMGKRGKPLAPSKISSGYLTVTLCRDGKQTSYLVHRLVAMAHIPNPSGFKIVNHLDGCKTNNHLRNLEWTTIAGNTQHAYDMGLKEPSRGEYNGRSKLTEEIALAIRAEYAEGCTSHRKLGEKYGVAKSVIGSIINRKTWAHI